MRNPPSIWLDYRPVRIGWVIPNQDIAQLATAVTWNACLWGGRSNCIIPAHDVALADHLVTCFGVDVLLPVGADDEKAKAFIQRFPHLEHDSWRDNIFEERRCAYVDIRHAVRRFVAYPRRDAQPRVYIPTWEEADPLDGFLTVLLGRYPKPDADVADYKGGVVYALDAKEIAIAPGGEIPVSLLYNDVITTLALTGYELSRPEPGRDTWLAPGIVLGSVTDFDALTMFWNLRAAGARLIYYDQKYANRLKAFANAFLSKFRRADLGGIRHLNFWTRSDPKSDDSWKPDLELADLSIAQIDGRGDTLYVEPNYRHFSVWYRDVIPSYTEEQGAATASFALPDRPFSDDDVEALNQKFAVVVNASQYGGPDAALTFGTPFIPRLNEFYGRNFYFDYDAARSQIGHLNKGAVAIIADVGTQRLQVSAFRVFEWMRAFFALRGINIERSEPGLLCSRLIAQMGGLDDCRVLKIRGVRNLLRKYGVEQSFTRSGAMDAIRDVDRVTGKVGFDAFEDLYIEPRRGGDLKPDDVLRYLLERRVFRVGLKFTCPNCQLPSWIHLDDVKTSSNCSYCDHSYDVTPQLKDRDWRYRRSGIFGREDNQLGSVPVALTLLQLSHSLRSNLVMYSTATNFNSAGADIEPCESDFVAVVASRREPVQLILGEAKTEGTIDAEDIRKLGKLADSIPGDFARAYILISKTDAFTAEEIALARTLNSQHNRRVILWSREELEPFYPYERSKTKLGDHWHAVSLADLVRNTSLLYFSS
jgi:hypothetical protein